MKPKSADSWLKWCHPRFRINFWIRFRYLPLIITLPLAIAFSSCSSENSGAEILRSNSPAKVVDAYVGALIADDPGTGFWEYAYKYNQEVYNARENLPKEMWDERTKSIRQVWRAAIERQRKSGEALTFEDACWLIFRPGAQVRILETRSQQKEGEKPREWKSFVKLVYPVQDRSPLFRARNASRYLREVTAIVSITRASPTSDVLLVNDTCRLVPDDLALWPVPALSNDVALALAKSALPHDLQHREATLLPHPAVVQQDARSNSWQSFADRVDELKTFYRRNGFKVEGFQLSQGFWYADGYIEPPEIWRPYQVVTSPGSSIFRLEDSVFTEIVNIDQTEESAMATLRVRYDGCTPICTLIRELWGKDTWLGPRIFQDFPTHDWPKQEERRISYSWDGKQGWRTAGVR